MKLTRGQKEEIMAELLKTGKFGSVKFSSAHGKNKWSVYLRPKSDRTGVHFHISYVDGGFVSQDEYRLPHKSYYAYGYFGQQSRPKLTPTSTPMDAIREVAQLLNNGYKVHKL